MMYSKIKLLGLTFQNFLNNNNGQIAIMLAVLLLPITTFIGASIDWSQKLNAESKMQSTIDSAILAVARQLTVKKKLNEGEMNSIAKIVFDTNISVPGNIKIEDFVITYKDDLLKITQTAEVDTTFLKLIDISTMYISVVSEVVVKFEGVDIALAVDLSGSMGGNKIQHLRSATASLLEELSKANLDEIRVAFVPWTRGVNLKGYYYAVTQQPGQNGQQPQSRVIAPQANISGGGSGQHNNGGGQNYSGSGQNNNSGGQNYSGSGQNNNGQHNSGDHNNGNYNSGNHNNGNYNSGRYNNGNYNSGNNNSGNYNSGDHNNGNDNTGNHNNGNDNSGNYNNGSDNTGNNNNGNENSGNHNNGNENSGNHNNGNNNHGNYNNGSYNHGNNNNGNYNMGNFNNGNGIPGIGGVGGGGSGSGGSGSGSGGSGSGGSGSGGSGGSGSGGSGTPDEPANTCVGTREDGKLRANETTIDHPLENNCPSAKLIPLTDILEVKNGKTGRQRLEDIANSWTTRGGTGSHNGMYWAAATLNPAFYPVFGTKTPAEPDAIKKYIIVMTDGLNNRSQFSTQMLAACTQAKAQGISIYSIVLMETSQTVVNTFKACATSDVSGRRYFIQTSDSALLKEDFRRIVGEIGQFYLSK